MSMECTCLLSTRLRYKAKRYVQRIQIAICDEVGRVKRDERGLATIKRVKGNDNKFETEVIEKRVSVYPLTMKKLQEFRREQEDAKEKGVKYKKVF